MVRVGEPSASQPQSVSAVATVHCQQVLLGHPGRTVMQRLGPPTQGSSQISAAHRVLSTFFK